MVSSVGRNIRFGFCLLAFIGSVVVLVSLADLKSAIQNAKHENHGRNRVSLVRLSFGDGQNTSANPAVTLVHKDAVNYESAGNESSACTPRTVEAYPPDLFTLEQKQRGAIAIHAFAMVWLFIALAIVCDNYFVASLEVVCETLHLKPDVAGATFMAAGSSAPELLASVIGVFLAQSDVGVSTILGSAIFNNLMIVSLCGFAASGVVYLSWWPVARDCGFYCFSVAALIVVIFDGVVHWYESVVQLALFAAYIVVMVFNNKIDSAISKRFPRLATGGAQRFYEQQQRSGRGSKTNDDLSSVINDCDNGEDDLAGAAAVQSIEIWTVETDGSFAVNNEQASVTLTNTGPASPFQPPIGWLRRIYWAIGLPWTIAFYLTIPDCRRPGIWRKLFVLTFLVSVLWVSGLIYMLVWMVCAVGDAMGIPDTVMGLTLLSVGTCLPDAMAGIFVSRNGLADMAIANSIASNVFDITACLGLPWFISTALLSPGSTVIINSSGLTYTAITLLLSIVFLLVATHVNRMLVDKKIAVVCLLVYLGIITVACLHETNVFGPANPPACPRQRL